MVSVWKKTILLLGASSDQLFAIRTAKEMGLRTVVLDIYPSSPGFNIADDYCVISTRDTDAIIRFAENYQKKIASIDGVLVMGSDIPQVVCKVAKHFGLPHIPLKTAQLATHKYRMKCCFRDHNIPIPWFSKVNSLKQLKQVIDERGYPVIIKPVDRSGARGVYYIKDSNNISDLYESSREISYSGEVMVEEYLLGPQISTESIMYKGSAYTPGFADRNYEMLERFSPNIIENGGSVPSILNERDRNEIELLVENAALALDVETGVVKGDVVLTPEGPKMIEMATRLSGGDFSESLIPLGCGVNIIEAAIDIAVGEEPDLNKLEPRFNKGVVNRYFFPKPGRLIRVEGYDEILKYEWIKKLEIWYKQGDIVPEVKSHADRFGVFIAIGKTLQEAQARADLVYKTVKIITEPV